MTTMAATNSQVRRRPAGPASDGTPTGQRKRPAGLRPVADGDRPMVRCPRCTEQFSLDEAVLSGLLGAELERRDAHHRDELSRVRAEGAAEAQQAAAALQASTGAELGRLQKQALERERELTVVSRRAEEADLRVEQLVRERVAAQRVELEAVVDARYASRLDGLGRANAELRATIEGLQRRAEQTSSERHGTYAEQSLVESLTGLCPHDAITTVRRGQRGADVLQRVRDRDLDAGLIVWESKNAQQFSRAWLGKLKNDVARHHGSVGVLVCDVLPAGVQLLGLVDGVWVVQRGLVSAFTPLLRQGLLDVARVRALAPVTEGAREAVFSYLTGEQFVRRIQAMLEPLQEQRAVIAKLEQSVTRELTRIDQLTVKAGHSAAAFLGDLQALTPDISAPVALELPGAEA